jgi:hypothetical protein
MRGKHGVGSEYRRRRHDKDFSTNEEEERHVESVKFRHRDYDHRKEIHVSFRAIKRFLEAHVGQEWDLVYSKVRRKFRKNNYVSHLMLDVLKMCVRSETNRAWWRSEHYVVQDGVLCKSA